MNSKIKALGLALVPTFALSAAMVSAASAQFTSDREHTILSGSQIGSHVLEPGSGFGGIACRVATFSATAVNKSQEDQLIDPTYDECIESAFGRKVDVDDKGFTYTFTPAIKTKDGTTHGASVHVSGELVLTVTNSSNTSVLCTITMKAQTNTGVAFHNLGGTKGIEVTTNVGNFKSTFEGGFFNCGASTTQEAGTYSGNTIITGKGTAGDAAAISVDEAVES